ncbi:pyroglutamyl-peptidase I [Microcella daejeonensis]|uniref:Pyroglutamyl-peptidase I n=1 Tax=Microcella daejeonensis TaxID=2994971 RepID=A0A9E8SA86_9MICO|nr:pyroglutamyl-peptidase I [Microcella daejeonensis]WAB82804.1 pyroglutamyl-peptidase I [Microcella daejeonensis]WAB82805.1 pyroglutamyl-peptidase I [Microcella daejeonensis]
MSGFEAFGGAASNPSGDVVRRLALSGHPGVRLSTVVLPVAFAASGGRLRAAVDEFRPDVVIALGLAEGRSGITPERVAINLDDARIPDNDGAQPIDERIELHGPDGRFTGLPVKAIVDALQKADLPASVSLSAGSYVCNHVFYVLQALAEQSERQGRPLRSGFIHVPASPELAAGHPGMPSLSLDELERGIRIVIDTVVATPVDARLPGGAIH